MIVLAKVAPTIGIVLAGGQSKRMGQNKAKLRLGGISLLDHMLQRLHSLGITDCRVSGSFPSYPCIEDQHPSQGPVAALFSLALALPDSNLLMVPVDMPGLDEPLLRYLLDSLTNERCIHFRDAPLPMRLTTDGFARQALAECLEQPDRGQRSLRNALPRLLARDVDLPEWADSLALNSLNTPDDWTEWLARTNSE
ncbi:MAG: molybdenum cofactor guanylyltransferase [Pseudomarimonas sp.]